MPMENLPVLTEVPKIRLVLRVILPFCYERRSPSTGGEYDVGILNETQFILSIDPFLLTPTIFIPIKIPSTLFHAYCCRDGRCTCLEESYQTKTYEVNLFSNIDLLKNSISSSFNLDPKNIRFVHKGKVLSNSRTFSFYNISSSDLLILVLEIHGGSKSTPTKEEVAKLIKGEKYGIPQSHPTTTTTTTTSLSPSIPITSFDLDSNSDAVEEKDDLSSLVKELKVMRAQQDIILKSLASLAERNEKQEDIIKYLSQNILTSPPSSSPSSIPSSSTNSTLPFTTPSIIPLPSSSPYMVLSEY